MIDPKLAKLFSLLLVAAALMTNGCAPALLHTEAMAPGVYRISAPGSSRKILAETMKTAIEQCEQENRHYLFVKNIFQHGSTLGFDTVSYTLYFTCVEEEDPRLKQQRKSRQRPAEGKAVEEQPAPKIPPLDQKRGQPESRPAEKIIPDRERPAAPQPEASPAPEPARKKPAARPDKKAAPAPEKQSPPQEENNEPQKTEEKQPAKKNPGPGELEELQKDTADHYDEPGDSRIIEEALEGEYPLFMENYLKRRLRKKKKTN